LTGKKGEKSVKRKYYIPKCPLFNGTKRRQVPAISYANKSRRTLVPPKGRWGKCFINTYGLPGDPKGGKKTKKGRRLPGYQIGLDQLKGSIWSQWRIYLRPVPLSYTLWSEDKCLEKRAGLK